MAQVISFIGMVSSGKSTIAREYARRVGMDFLDIDEEIEKVKGKSVIEVLEEIGATAFSELESLLALNSLNERRKDSLRNETTCGLCLAPGGSIVYNKDVMDALRSAGPVIWIDAELDLILERLALQPKAIVGLPQKTLGQIYSERQPLYEQYADIRISPMSSDVDQNARLVAEELGKFTKRRKV